MSFRKGIRRLSLLTALLFSATLWLSPAVRAADSDLDLTFNGTGIVTTDHATFDIAQDLVIQPDGKIVVAGATGRVVFGEPDTDIMVARYNVDGSLDTTFGIGGIVTTDLGGTTDSASGVALQSDGRIVVAGTSGPLSDMAMAVVRYNADGALDTTFGAGGIVTTVIGLNAYAVDLAIQPDGKIVAAGTSAPVGGGDTYTLARYNTDGSLDVTFGAGGVFVTPLFSYPTVGGRWARAVALQSDGKILVAGEGINGATNGLTCFTVVRYTMDGALDSTFGSGGFVFTETLLGPANDLVIQPDGKIVVAGTIGEVTSPDFGIARYNTDGSPDATFGTDGIVTTNVAVSDHATGVALQSDGRIVVAGDNGGSFLEASEFEVVRYNTNGSLDTTFGIGGIVTTAVGVSAAAGAVAFDPDGRIVTAGVGNLGLDWTTFDFLGDFAVVRYGAPAPVNNPPVVTITGPASGSVYAVNTPINFTGTFTDDAGDTHTATWTFDSLTNAATIVEPSGSTPGSANTTYSFTQAGVYKVKLTVTDNGGLSGTSTTVGGYEAMVVIYDPSAGWVTGGGWINSPAGALGPFPSLTGKANFGFVSKYNKGATVPTGNTEFQFKAGGLNFKSTSYEWMVVSGGRKAQYKGVGTINGSGAFRFMLTAIDGDQPGGDGHDKFRIRIWSDVNGVIYDNQMNDPDSHDPTTVLGGGSIVIHQ